MEPFGANRRPLERLPAIAGPLLQYPIEKRLRFIPRLPSGRRIIIQLGTQRQRDAPLSDAHAHSHKSVTRSIRFSVGYIFIFAREPSIDPVLSGVIFISNEPFRSSASPQRAHRLCWSITLRKFQLVQFLKRALMKTSSRTRSMRIFRRGVSPRIGPVSPGRWGGYVVPCHDRG